MSDMNITDRRSTSLLLRSEAVSTLLHDDDEDNYESLVAAGRAVVNTAWLLGDLAAKVEVKYGENRLAEYARDIDVPYRTLLNCRTVSLAYPQSSRHRELSFGAAQALAALPDRESIVDRKPGLTVAEARAIARDRRAIESTEQDFARREQKGEGATVSAPPDGNPSEDAPPDYEAMLRDQGEGEQ